MNFNPCLYFLVTKCQINASSAGLENFRYTPSWKHMFVSSKMFVISDYDKVSHIRRRVKPLCMSHLVIFHIRRRRAGKISCLLVAQQMMLNSFWNPLFTCRLDGVMSVENFCFDYELSEGESMFVARCVSAYPSRIFISCVRQRKLIILPNICLEQVKFYYEDGRLYLGNPVGAGKSMSSCSSSMNSPKIDSRRRLYFRQWHYVGRKNFSPQIF